MAKKGKAAKRRTTTRRRRSVGAINKSLLAKAAGAIGGYVAAEMLTSKVAPTMDAKIKGAAVIAIGLFGVPMLLKNEMGEGLALGFAVSGGHTILKGMNIISGTRPMMLPYNQQRQIAGPGVPGFVNGAGVPGFVNGAGRPRMGAMQTALKYG